MKKLLLLLLLSMFLLTSCNQVSEDKIFDELGKSIENYDGYNCISNFKITMDGKESIYIIDESYSKPDKYSLEILKPEESKGCIITYEGNKVFLKNPSIEQSISIKPAKELNRELFIGGFFEKVSSAKYLGIDVIDEKEYYTFEIDINEKNKYTNMQKVWLNKKDFTPHKLNILDENGELRVEVIYENFKFTKEKDKR